MYVYVCVCIYIYICIHMYYNTATAKDCAERAEGLQGVRPSGVRPPSYYITPSYLGVLI